MVIPPAIEDADSTSTDLVEDFADLNLREAASAASASTLPPLPPIKVEASTPQSQSLGPGNEPSGLSTWLCDWRRLPPRSQYVSTVVRRVFDPPRHNTVAEAPQWVTKVVSAYVRACERVERSSCPMRRL
eukprot:GHVS01049024.1.p1 GENE.GHVS01049024.1~~GHVS01049024.1.p1  ORF type:complete len:130 (-),score=9.39 GHVS01049024.1:491-880(-)